jgi:poly(glycerol-phosphate) alpha-glucosyltransferase
MESHTSMKVTFLTPSVSRALGGIYEIERDLAHALHANADVEMAVVGLRDEYTSSDLPAWDPLEPEVVPVKGPRAFGYSPNLWEAVVETDPDLVHLHSLWMYPSIVARRWHKRTGRPHVVTIHGMLDDWALRNAAWKKKVACWLYEWANLKSAACLQVNSEREYASVRALGIDTPVCIIPNGVTLPQGEAAGEPHWTGVIPTSHRVLLFLGRIHPKKGLDELFTAWQRCKAQGAANDWSLAVVGWDDGGHETYLRQRLRNEQLPDVHLLGPMFGDDKVAAFQEADAFVLPSHSEGFPMAVLEAWSHGLPVLLTPGCNLQVGVDRGAAIETNPAVETLTPDLAHFLSRPADALIEMGVQGRKLVEAQFTWSRVAEEMHVVYTWAVAQEGPVPDSVRLA